MNIKRIVRKLLGTHEVKIHGHELVIQRQDEILAQINKHKGEKVIIEIGSQREAGSTLYFSKLALQNSLQFITVDLNKETTKAAEGIVKSVSSSFEAVNDFGEKYLSTVDREIALLYLDAFDIDGDWHDGSLRNWYKEKGADLNDENCWKMHLECAEAVVDKIIPGGYIAFDDVNPVDESGQLVLKPVSENYALWSGKGKTAIPYLLENGFKIVGNKRSAALLQKGTGK